MLIILSPAKNLNMKSHPTPELFTTPIFIKEASILIKELINYSPPELESMMRINSQIAELNYMSHIRWNEEHNLSTGKQAILAFNGAVFQGINPYTLNESQFLFANKHLRILSGLYGVLRPLDIIQPYRLEMAIKLKNPLGTTLYDFWKDKLTNYFIEELNLQGEGILFNLASKEYSSSIDLCKINSKIITPIFMDYRRGSHKVITIYTKRARGLMSRFIVDNNIDSLKDIKQFNEEDYSFNEYMSTDTKWVFTR